MNRINPKKLLNSKWTATKPLEQQKHFIVTKVRHDELGNVETCLLEAVLTKRSTEIDWKALQDTQLWRQGWT
ncbi:MAG: TIGR02450 family Trp-rich protein [Kangiellaceae bacterium]|jgi:tryptophan-rich hypothetical protein|nr:TIGR02450 family Trp-rich protein [Kangiellaceae bacterium]